jgi:thioredoxin 1
MLYTNLKHIESAGDHKQAISENARVMIVCGRMGAASVPVYRITEELEAEYCHVKFFDMEFDNPESQFLCSLFELQGASLPLIVYYSNGNVVRFTTGTQTREQIADILNEEFSPSKLEKVTNL